MRGGLGRPVGSGIFEAVGGVTCVGVFVTGIVVFTNLSCVGSLVVCLVVGLSRV